MDGLINTKIIVVSPNNISTLDGTSLDPSMLIGELITILSMSHPLPSATGNSKPAIICDKYRLNEALTLGQLASQKGCQELTLVFMLVEIQKQSELELINLVKHHKKTWDYRVEKSNKDTLHLFHSFENKIGGMALNRGYSARANWRKLCADYTKEKTLFESTDPTENIKFGSYAYFEAMQFYGDFLDGPIPPHVPKVVKKKPKMKLTLTKKRRSNRSN